MKNFLIAIFLFWSELAFSCAGCAGSMSNTKDKITTYTLIVFILLIYIPYYLILRVVRKANKLQNAAVNEKIE